MQHPYVTYDDNYIESVWWSLKTIADKGLLYKGHKVVPYCPRCGTALSSHEVAQGYKDVTETSVYVKFRVRGQENTFLLAWTTTPWTLPSNVALVVNEHEDYVYAEKDGETYILAKALCEKVVARGRRCCGPSRAPSSSARSTSRSIPLPARPASAAGTSWRTTTSP